MMTLPPCRLRSRKSAQSCIIRAPSRRVTRIGLTRRIHLTRFGDAVVTKRMPNEGKPEQTLASSNCHYPLVIVGISELKQTLQFGPQTRFRGDNTRAVYRFVLTVRTVKLLLNVERPSMVCRAS